MSEEYDKWEDNAEAHEGLRLCLLTLSERLERVEKAVTTIAGLLDAKWDIMWYDGGDPQSLKQEESHGENEEVSDGTEHDRINSEKDAPG